MALNLPTLTFHAYRSFCVHSYDLGAFHIGFRCKFSLCLNHHYYKRGVNSYPDVLTNLDTGCFRRPESVRPVSVPSHFQQVSGSGVASQANEAGTLPLKPARSPTTFTCMLICIRAWPSLHRGVPPGSFSRPVDGRTGREPSLHPLSVA